MITVHELRKKFESGDGQVRAVNGVSFTVPQGKLFTLLGPSGCGKTTSLRCVAGLEQPDGGKITIGGTPVYDSTSKYSLPVEQRAIGMVFQSYAIWPHMTVYQNVAYPLKPKRLSKKETREKVERILELVGLLNLIDRPAPNLSGGQQQRVALARALVAQPKVLLLDEPLSNLDAKLRQQMRTELKNLQRQTGVTSLYVTHDQEEALAVSDLIAVMRDGIILEVGQPLEIYKKPKHRYTADFLGQANFIPGHVLCSQNGIVEVDTPAGILRCTGSEAPKGQAVTVFFRPECASVYAGEFPRDNILRGTVQEFTFLGQMIDCTLVLRDGVRIKLRMPPRQLPEPGQALAVVIDEGDCSLICQ